MGAENFSIRKRPVESSEREEGHLQPATSALRGEGHLLKFRMGMCAHVKALNGVSDAAMRSASTVTPFLPLRTRLWQTLPRQ